MPGLSEHFAMSPQYIAKQYKAAYHKTVGESIRDLRMEKAREYLRHSHLGIGEIAHFIGYEDENYFSKIFKGSTGITPLQYRKGKDAL